LSEIERVSGGKDVLVLATGSIAAVAAEAAGDLAKEGVQATVAVAATLNPAPSEALIRLARDFPLVVTVEEHFATGGLGSMAAEALAGAPSCPRLLRLGVETMTTGLTGSMDYMRGLAGLTRARIAARALEALRGPAR
jgi:transketolase